MNKSVYLKRGDLVIINVRGSQHKTVGILLKNIDVYDANIFAVSLITDIEKFRREMFEIHKLT